MQFKPVNLIEGDMARDTFLGVRVTIIYNFNCLYKFTFIFGEGGRGRSCQGALVVVNTNGTLCAKFGHDWRTENFWDKQTKMANAEPEICRTIPS